MSRSVEWYGWHPDLPDHRDFKYEATLKPAEIITDQNEVDLIPDMPAVQDQGQVGSCTAHATVAVLGHNMIVQKRPFFWPSRLFAYYNARALEGTAGIDNGANLRDVVASLAKTGYCPENDWPYDVSQLTVQPTADSYNAASANKIRLYARLNNLEDMLMCLAAGYPFVFGFTVYESFESDEVANTGVLNMPAANESPVGGHAVCAVGYDLDTKRLIARNSWGADWGQKGYFTIPFDYVTNRDLADDFWTIRF